MAHPLHTAVEALEAAVDQTNSETGMGVSALSRHELQELTTRTWQLIQRVQGSLLLLLVAEASRRSLFRHPDYAAASSMRDLIAGWLRCSPAVAGRLLFLTRHLVSGAYATTGQTLAAGEIDVDHARAVVRSVRALPPGVLSEEQRAQAESTMLDTARVTDAEVTGTAGRRLSELLAPQAAQEHADRAAERDRVRAESARWMEVTGFGISGAKEFRLRAESEVIDALIRVVSPLVQPASSDGASDAGSTGDAMGNDATAWFGSDAVGAVPADADLPDVASARAVPAAVGSAHAVPADDGSGEIRAAAVGSAHAVPADDGSEEIRAADDAAARMNPVGSQAPGNVAGDRSDRRPIERRRADAMVEVIDALARPDLLDDLTANQLRSLADELDGGVVGSPWTRSTPEVDTELTALVDAGQVATDSCDTTNPADTGATSRPTGSRPTRSRPTGSEPRTDPAETGANAVTRVAERPQGSTARSGRARSRGGAARVRAERASLVVIAPYDQQRGRPDAGEAISTGAPTRLASATEIERLACEATITPVWMTGDATPVTVAAPTRFFRGKQLAALIARDRGCAFPSCSRGLRYAHAHHIVKWSEGGPTSVDNGVLLCGHHHRLIHGDSGWTVRLGADGLPEFVPPHWIDPRRQPQRHNRFRLGLPFAA